MKKRVNGGQMFIELVVGVAIVMVTLVGIVALSITSSKTGRVAGNRNEATVYAEKFLEGIRRERDADPTGFFSGSRASGSCVVNSPYTCYVTYTPSATPTDTLTVSVVVRWDDGSNTYHVTEQTVLTNN